MDPAALKAWIKEEALRCGFALSGVAPLGGWPSASHLAPWLEAGHHGTMEWLAREPERRIDLRARFPWARSVLMVGMTYRTADPAPAPERRPFSRYAWGDDYHDLMTARLRALGERIEAGAGPHRRWHYVDTGPLLERAAAAAAGAGFIAKNTMVIAEREGSYLFLGALILELELLPDRPAPGRCGTCTRCLEACPTRAFPAPYLLDARRCISYLTIELRGPIPRELRAPMGQMVFGCDICQEVCPWNERAFRREAPSSEGAFRPRPGLARPDLGLLIALLSMDDATFRRRFRGSAVKRAKRVGLARNAAVALGNRGDPLAIPALARAARHEPSPLVRGHACWALGRLLALPRLAAGLRDDALSALRAAFGDADPFVVDEARAALGS